MLGCIIQDLGLATKFGERKVTVARTVAEYTLTHTIVCSS